MILGPPGGGKGTLSKRLVRDFGLKHVSSGDALRQHIADGTEIGVEVEGIVKAGDLVPDELMVNLIAETIQNVMKSGSPLLLDGFPRTIEQAVALNDLQPVDVVLNLDVPDEEIVERLAHRRVHVPSGRVYHNLYNPPKVEGKDDETGDDLIQRPDDAPDAVLDRLDNYRKLTAPLVDHFGDIGYTFTGTESDVIYPVMKAYMSGWLSARNA